MIPTKGLAETTGSWSETHRSISQLNLPLVVIVALTPIDMEPDTGVVEDHFPFKGTPSMLIGGRVNEK